MPLVTNHHFAIRCTRSGGWCPSWSPRPSGLRTS